MQPVLNVEDIKRVEIVLTRVGVSVSGAHAIVQVTVAQEALAWEGTSQLSSS